MIRIRWRSADLPKAMAELTRQGIMVYGVREVDEVTIAFSVKRGAEAALQWVCQRLGDQMEIIGKKGLYWRFAELRKRPVLVLGVLLLVITTLLLPTRVLFLRVEGNVYVPSNRILEAAQACGIAFGANRREVRSEQMKNRLLEQIPQLQWVGVNTYGCVAVISVREKPMESESSDEAILQSVVAARDGVVLSATATAGNLLCAPGQAVKEGQVLISPYLDCGICLRLEKPEGEIWAQTKHEISALTPIRISRKGNVRRCEVKFSLLIGKKRINLWKDSGIWDSSCGRMYEEYYITLPGGFQLPIGLAKDTMTYYEMSDGEVDAAYAEQLLVSIGRERLYDSMIAGQILQEWENFARRGGIYVLTGHYRCTEMIGRVRNEQIGDWNGKNN